MSNTNERFLELAFTGAAWGEQKQIKINIAEAVPLTTLQVWTSNLQSIAPSILGLDRDGAPVVQNMQPPVMQPISSVDDSAYSSSAAMMNNPVAAAGMEVIVPAGAVAGQKLQVKDAQGHLLEFVIPAGASPGSKLRV